MSTLKYRHLGRDSAHRRALLRNLVTSLIANESISTTWPKAKEAQRLAEKLITLGKKNTGASRERAKTIFHLPEREGRMDKLFGELRERYANRPGGFTRVLRQEPIRDDSAPSAILSLVDGPRDMRFSMTAKAIVRQRKENLSMNEMTLANMRKVTRFRKDGEVELEEEIGRLEKSAAEQEQKELDDLEDGTVYEWARGEKSRPSGIKSPEKIGPGRLRRQRFGEDREVPQ